MFKLATGNNKHPTLYGEDRGGVRVLLLSEVTKAEYNFSTILSPIVAYFNSNLNLLLLKTFRVLHMIFFHVLIYEALSLKREYILQNNKDIPIAERLAFWEKL